MYEIDLMNSICNKAHAAGYDAVKSARVVPMIVGQETHLFSGVMDPNTIEYVEDGVCGFAWVDVYPTNKGNTRLGKAERKVLEAVGFKKDIYGKKYYKWVSEFNQSMQKKEAYASAYAKVLRENGLKAYSGSRMD
jgi:hypothetical protein